MTLIIVLVAVALIALWLVSLYNRLVSLRNNRENAFANIDVQLKQRPGAATRGHGQGVCHPRA